MIQVAPTEPAQLKALGEVSSFPETFGCDFLWVGQGMFWGVQRKEYKDFVASVYDGRLARELAQMRQVLSRGGKCLLLLEGEPSWTMEGQWTEGRGKNAWGLRAHHSYLFSVQQQGVWVDTSRNLADTADTIRFYQEWSEKPRHSGTSHRPNPVGVWGKASSREWMIHLLQGFPGVGSATAEAILAKFPNPLVWNVSAEMLMTVEGIGKKTAERLIQALA